jgi:MFS family permease
LRRDLAGLPRDAWVIAAGTFINKFGNFLNVFIVLYLTSRGYSAAEAGAALGAIGLGNFIGNALGGSLADAVGRRLTIVVSMFGAGILTMTAPLLLRSFPATVVVLAGIGLLAQLFRPAAGALLVDSVRPDQLLTAFALLRLAINVGMAVGPAVGGLLSSYSYTLIFIGDGVTSILFGFVALLFLRKSAATPAETPRPSARRSIGYGVVLRDYRYLAYLAAMVAATYVYIQSTATLPLAVHDVGLSNEAFGLLLGLNALLVVLLELPITQVTRKFPARGVIAAGLVFLGVGMAATGLADGAVALAVTVALWSLAEMVYTPVANAYPGEVASEEARGRYQGAEGLAHTLGATLGPAMGGALYALSGSAHWLSCLLVAWVGAGLTFLARPVARSLPKEDEVALAMDELEAGALPDARRA